MMMILYGRQEKPQSMTGEGAHSGWFSAAPAIRYGVSNPSYMRWAIMPWAACLRLWQRV